MLTNKRPSRPRDTNELAKRVVDVATEQATDDMPEPAGRAIGGRARAASMTPEERSEAGRLAAAARWGNRA